MNRLELPNVTLFAVACTKVDETIHALRESTKDIEYADVLLFTHEKRKLKSMGITVVPIKKLDYKGYNHFILYRLKDFIKTDFCLLVQNDGYVLRPEKWDNHFLDYDYIGAPWPKQTHFTQDGTEVRVGNGGFSLRSQKLLQALGRLKLPFTDKGTGFYHEDGVICVYYRKELEKSGVRFAPVDVASRFSREKTCDDSVSDAFGFHNLKNQSPLLLARPWLKKIGL